MSKLKKSLSDIFNTAAIGTATIGAMGIAGSMIAPVAGVGVAMGAAAGLIYKKKGMLGTNADTPAATADLPAPEEIDVSVETGQPVKAMKTIRLRR